MKQSASATYRNFVQSMGCQCQLNFVANTSVPCKVPLTVLKKYGVNHPSIPMSKAHAPAGFLALHLKQSSLLAKLLQSHFSHTQSLVTRRHNQHQARSAIDQFVIWHLIVVQLLMPSEVQSFVSLAQCQLRYLKNAFRKVLRQILTISEITPGHSTKWIGPTNCWATPPQLPLGLSRTVG